jgi:hypothetical protein
LGVKYFMDNIFCILRCLVQPKIMVNGNHFQFDCKSLFNFWKTIYGFKNHKSFSKFKLFILVGTFVGIHHRRALEFVCSPNQPPKVPEFWYPIAEFRQNRPKPGWCRNLALSAWIQWRPAPSLDSGDRILAV